MLLLLLGCAADLLSFPTCQEDPSGLAPVETPTWTDGVGQVLLAECAGCHDGGGLTPFPLQSYDDVVAVAAQVAEAVSDRRMPPPGPTDCGGCQTFRNDRWLDAADVALVTAWVDGGTPLGGGVEPPLPAPPAGLSAPDATLDIGVDYAPTSADGGSDDYRCFVVDPGLDQDRFLTAHDVVPGNADLVHHVLLYQPVSADAVAQAEALDSAQADPGYTCFGSPGVDADVLAAWAPGVGATVYPEGTGLRVVAGRKLVVQVHYNLDGGAGTDRTTIGLALAASVQDEAEIQGLFNDDFRLDPGQVLVLDQHTEPAIAKDAGALTLWGVLPHMHTLGISLNVQARSRDAATCLVDVPHWDFNWQGFYFYETPVVVDGDDAITISCAWSTQNRTEPVTWGDGTEDEMCLAYFYMTWGA